MTGKKFHWIKLAFQLKGSVVLAIHRRVLACGFFGIFVSLLYYLKLPVSQPIFESVIPSIVLGLLLVFRTNTAYDRFWEGRKCWGSMVNNTRNLARQILVSIDEITPEDKENKMAALYLLVAFSVATKYHLRGEPVSSELEELMGHSRYLKLKTLNNPPLKIAFWIGDYLQRQYKGNCLCKYQLIAIQDLLNNLVDNLGACERILKTPIPLAYAIHLKQLLLVYCLLLPFQLVESLGWWTGLITAFVSFTLFGIEAIGIEIENPFGHDANDLQLETICNTMKRNIDDLIKFNPYVRSHHDNINN
ncbi:hypothetical protein OGM63_22990 [Plectonema radiosum NIES-515]|uniref:Uncharacterized protein n=1 Tax=Plectonema radiosum NIES-515 TaxID=2986073 RepID=A0ABT3B4P0_9CYAN|nr:bestrophin family ion channel [Plectonema radiosum]MCV3216343.1 hypothetical protein [Plectonema radiosum NIES-515]